MVQFGEIPVARVFRLQVGALLFLPGVQVECYAHSALTAAVLEPRAPVSPGAAGGGEDNVGRL